jgi:hypothetical protein
MLPLVVVGTKLLEIHQEGRGRLEQPGGLDWQPSDHPDRIDDSTGRASFAGTCTRPDPPLLSSTTTWVTLRFTGLTMTLVDLPQGPSVHSTGAAIGKSAI